jgi:ubiquitin C-terminal hydrolase
MQGNETEYYSCDECKGKTAATINMRIHRFPRILMLHIKRFTYTGENAVCCRSQRIQLVSCLP